MSIMTGHLGPREGLLLVDTLGVSPFDTAFRMHVSKAFSVPHLGAVFATRGAAVFPAMLLTAINSRPLADASFDALVAVLDDVVREAYALARPILDESGITHQAELIIVGWSDAARRMISISMKNYDDADASLYGGHLDFSPNFRRVEIPDGAFMVPGIDAPAEMAALMKEWKRLDQRQRLVAAARAQRLNVDKRWPGFIGGRLILTSVSRHVIEQRVVFEWPDDRIGSIAAIHERAPVS